MDDIHVFEDDQMAFTDSRYLSTEVTNAILKYPQGMPVSNIDCIGCVTLLVFLDEGAFTRNQIMQNLRNRILTQRVDQ